jgi:DNA-binding response OmpR family regulator
MRIIVIEDDFLVAADLTRTLRMGGHQVIGPANTARKASELVSAERPDLALVDIRLADGDSGPDLARELWEQHRMPSLFVTANAYDRPGYTEAALGMLAKPVSPISLLRSIGLVHRILHDEPLTSQDVPTELRLFVSL